MTSRTCISVVRGGVPGCKMETWVRANPPAPAADEGNAAQTPLFLTRPIIVDAGGLPSEESLKCATMRDREKASSADVLVRPARADEVIELRHRVLREGLS